MNSTITSKGQTTIPAEIRNRMQAKPGTRLKWFIDVDGRIVVLAERPISAIRGILKGYPPLTLDEPEKIAAIVAIERDNQSRRRR